MVVALMRMLVHGVLSPMKSCYGQATANGSASPAGSVVENEVWDDEAKERYNKMMLKFKTADTDGYCFPPPSPLLSFICVIASPPSSWVVYGTTTRGHSPKG